MKTVIIDGDILIYKIPDGIINQITEPLDYEDETMLYRKTEWGSKIGIKHYLDKKIKQIKKQTNSNYCVICLSSPVNFRKELNPSYKSNRQKLKPFVYKFVREYLKSKYRTFEREGLEADDLIGIMATYKGKLKGLPEGDKVIWSPDKDFKTIPATFYRAKNDGSLKKFVISEREADYYWMYQTLTGDSADGYSGCPRIGSSGAYKILGSVSDFELMTAWSKVVEAFKKQGLSEDDAIMQARMARILRSSDYDFKTKQIKLWQKTLS